MKKIIYSLMLLFFQVSFNCYSQPAILIGSILKLEFLKFEKTNDKVKTFSDEISMVNNKITMEVIDIVPEENSFFILAKTIVKNLGDNVLTFDPLNDFIITNQDGRNVQIAAKCKILGKEAYSASSDFFNDKKLIKTQFKKNESTTWDLLLIVPNSKTSKIIISNRLFPDESITISGLGQEEKFLEYKNSTTLNDKPKNEDIDNTEKMKENMNSKEVIELSDEENEDEIFFFVEEMPVFQDNKISFSDYISQNLLYPEIAAKNGITGKVIISFVIDKKGEVVNAKVARGADPELDKEALRVVMSSPSWEPGKQNGKPVKVQFVYPVVFALQ
jgi:TonB family protein